MTGSLLEPVAAPEIVRPVKWGEFGGIIGNYDEALMSCNDQLRGIRESIQQPE